MGTHPWGTDGKPVGVPQTPAKKQPSAISVEVWVSAGEKAEVFLEETNRIFALTGHVLVSATSDAAPPANAFQVSS